MRRARHERTAPAVRRRVARRLGGEQPLRVRRPEHEEARHCVPARRVPGRRAGRGVRRDQAGERRHGGGRRRGPHVRVEVRLAQAEWRRGAGHAGPQEPLDVGLQPRTRGVAQVRGEGPPHVAEHAWHDLLVPLARQLAQREPDVGGGVHPGRAHFIPQRAPQHRAEEGVAHPAQGPALERGEARAVEPRQHVPVVAGVRVHEPGRRLPGGFGHLGHGPRELERDDDRRRVGVPQQELGAHRPRPRAGERPHRSLHQRQPGDLAAAQRHALLHLRHPRPEDELAAEVVEGPAPRPADLRQQVLPGRVRVRVAGEEGLHAGAERRLADQVVELLQHRRRLVVDDGPVGALGLVEVVERLPERRGPVGLVHAVGGRLVGEVERLPRAAGRVEVGERLRGHVGREPLLEPEVVEPLHRHEVAEPHVRDLVEHRGGAAQPLRQGRPLAEDEPVLVEEHRARVLHPPEGEGGREQELELVERIGAGEVPLHPRQRALVRREQRVEVRLAGAGPAHPRGDRPPARCGGGDVPGAGRERDLVGAERRRLGEAVGRRAAGGVHPDLTSVGERAPGGGRGQGEGHARLQVRLVEAGEELVRVGRHQQRVEVVVPVALVVKPDDARAARGDVGDERELEMVFAARQELQRDADVGAVRRALREVPAVGRGRREPAAAEVEDDVLADLEVEADAHPPHGAVGRRDVEAQRVPDLAQVAGAVCGQRARHAVTHVRAGAARRRGGPGCRQQRGESDQGEHAPKLAADVSSGNCR